MGRRKEKCIMENIFEKGCLVQLSASVWGAARKINTEQLSDMEVSHDWLSATKKLVDPDSLKPLNKVVNTARSYLTGLTLPFPLHGMVFIPKEMISKVDNGLESYRSDFNAAVETFLSKYDELRDVAMVHLGDLFSEFDYPVDVRKKFCFVWRFVILDVPNGNTGILSPEVYEREKEKFVRTMEEARELAVQSLREEFSGMVQRITDRFSNGHDTKPKVFKNGTVHNFYEFFETFKERNIFKDEQLAELVERAREILGGQPAEAIRSDDQIKERIGKAMKDVEDSMAEILSMPRRRVIMS
jgi:hypothetical protein